MVTNDPFASGGEVARLARNFDWSGSPFGPVDRWSPTLRNTFRLILASRHPLAAWWGPDFRLIYNDACIPLLGDSHPRGLGESASQFWVADDWNRISGSARAILLGGPSTWHERMLVVVRRHGFAEEAYFTFSQSPI